jgi:hypothetical protein
MSRAALLAFASTHKLAVISTIAPGSRAPQGAVVGIAVTEHFEQVFDTLNTSRLSEMLLFSLAGRTRPAGLAGHHLF